MQLLAANNAQTVLASGINASATTLTLATGGGAFFPTPVAGTSLFKLTLLDAATETQNEIVHVTAVSGDTFTIVRGQEGTAARSWSANDIAMCAVTAGTLDFFAQLDSPTFTGNPQGPTRAVGDNTNGLATTAFTQAAIQAWGLGVSGSATPTYAVKPVSGTSTSPTQVINTLTTDVQATVQAPVSGERFGGWSIARDLRPAQMGVSGSGATASYWYRGFSATSAVQGDWKQLADIDSPTFTGTPKAPTATAGTNTTQIASTAFVQSAVNLSLQSHGQVEFTSNGTWTCPPGVTQIYLDGCAAGGGGAYSASGTTGGGGGGGGEAIVGQAITVSPGTTYSINIGGPGNGGTSSSVNGTQGGNTLFGPLVNLVGGFGGLANSTAGSAGGAGATAGIAGNFTSSIGFGGSGGSSNYGAGGAGGNGAAFGQIGGGFGSGGGGGANGNGGRGAYGFLRIWW